MDYTLFDNLIKLGVKNLKVTLKDGSSAEGDFVSYIADDTIKEKVKQITLAENGEIRFVNTEEIMGIDIILDERI